VRIHPLMGDDTLRALYDGRGRSAKLARDLARIMKERPKFDETEFVKYWPSELAWVALRIIELARKSWRPAGKMLYPNDPLPLFFYGSTGWLSRPRMIEPPPEFLESLSEFGYSQEEGPRLEMYFDLSDLVVICYDELRELEACAESLSENDGVE